MWRNRDDPPWLKLGEHILDWGWSGHRLDAAQRGNIAIPEAYQMGVDAVQNNVRDYIADHMFNMVNSSNSRWYKGQTRNAFRAGKEQGWWSVTNRKGTYGYNMAEVTHWPADEWTKFLVRRRRYKSVAYKY